MYIFAHTPFMFAYASIGPEVYQFMHKDIFILRNLIIDGHHSKGRPLESLRRTPLA